MYGNAIFSWVISNKLVTNLRVELIDKFLKADYQFIVNAERGDFTYRVMSTPGFVGKCMNNFVLLSVEIFKITMVFIALLMVDKTITFIISLRTIQSGTRYASVCYGDILAAYLPENTCCRERAVAEGELYGGNGNVQACCADSTMNGQYCESVQEPE